MFININEVLKLTTIAMTKKIEVYVDGSQEERDSFLIFGKIVENM